MLGGVGAEGEKPSATRFKFRSPIYGISMDQRMLMAMNGDPELCSECITFSRKSLNFVYFGHDNFYRSIATFFHDNVTPSARVPRSRDAL